MLKLVSLKNSINHLLNWLEKTETKEFHVVVMPDFFLDRFVSFKEDFASFSERALEVVHRQGGSIDNTQQNDSRGGNAANTAAALATLGVLVTPIIETDHLGFTLMKLFLKSSYISLSHIKTGGEASITTALEFKQNSHKVNLMLRDVGSLADFGPKNLASEDYQLLTQADFVCVFNWAGTHKYGTDLAETVFRYVKKYGKGKTYYDTADPTSSKEKIPDLIKRIFLKDLVDIVSLNENEAIQYATYISPKEVATLKRQDVKNLARKCATVLSKRIPARIDLHTATYSATLRRNNKPIVVPSLRVKVLRATGAGDAWNAGNMYAEQQGFPDEERLMFANAVAAYYVSSTDATHPTLDQLKDFLTKISKTR
jgi:sugar/nucleoside kinase (ribokinase family)